MAGPAEVFREAHRLRRHAKDLQTEIERAPRQLKAHQAKIARQEESLRQAQENLKHLKIAIKEKEVSLKAIFANIAKHEKQLNEAVVKKEYDALRSEIAIDKEKTRKIEEEIFTAMSETEDAAAQIPELEKAVQQAKKESADFEASSQSRMAGLMAQLKEAKSKLQEVEATLSDDVRSLYDRAVAGRGEEALSSLEGRTCKACYTEITAQSYNDLLAGRLVVCKACGRLLYRAESPQVED